LRVAHGSRLNHATVLHHKTAVNGGFQTQSLITGHEAHDHKTLHWVRRTNNDGTIAVIKSSQPQENTNQNTKQNTQSKTHIKTHIKTQILTQIFTQITTQIK